MDTPFFIFRQPQTPFALLVAMALGMMGLFGFLLRSTVRQQSEICRALSNHMAHDQEVLARIVDHMGTTNEMLRALSGEVLKSALRSPDSPAIHIPVRGPAGLAGPAGPAGSAGPAGPVGPVGPASAV